MFDLPSFDMLKLIATTALLSLLVFDGVASYNESGFDEKPSLGGARHPMLPSLDQVDTRNHGAMVNEMTTHYRRNGGKYAPNDENPNIQQNAELERSELAFSNKQHLMNPHPQRIQHRIVPPKIPPYQQQVPLYSKAKPIKPLLSEVGPRKFARGPQQEVQNWPPSSVNPRFQPIQPGSGFYQNGNMQDRTASFRHIPKPEGGPILQGNHPNSAHHRPGYATQPVKMQNNMKPGQPIWNPVNNIPPLYIPKSGNVRNAWPHTVGTGTSGDMTQVNGKKVPGIYNPSQNVENHGVKYIGPQKPVQQVKPFPEDQRKHGQFASPHGMFSTTKKPPFWLKGISVVKDLFRTVKDRAIESLGPPVRKRHQPSNTPKPPLWRRGVYAIKSFFKKAKDIAKGAFGLSLKEQRKENANSDQTERAKCNHHACRMQQPHPYEQNAELISQTPKPKVKRGILSRLNSVVNRLFFF